MELRSEYRVGPAAAGLVVVRITPWPGRDACVGREGAPLRISAWGMSGGVMSTARLDGSALALAAALSGFLTLIELSPGTPSTPISGWPSDAVLVVGPRIWICDAAPGSPEADVTFTFGA